MITTINIIFLVLFALVVLPTLAYMVVKFAMAGYYRAKERQREQQRKVKHEQKQDGEPT